MTKKISEDQNITPGQDAQVAGQVIPPVEPLEQMGWIKQAQADAQGCVTWCKNVCEQKNEIRITGETFVHLLNGKRLTEGPTKYLMDHIKTFSRIMENAEGMEDTLEEFVDTSKLKKGALTAKAKAAGEGTQEFAREKKNAPGKLGKEARLALAFDKMRKEDVDSQNLWEDEEFAKEFVELHMVNEEAPEVPTYDEVINHVFESFDEGKPEDVRKAIGFLVQSRASQVCEALKLALSEDMATKVGK